MLDFREIPVKSPLLPESYVLLGMYSSENSIFPMVTFTVMKPWLAAFLSEPKFRFLALDEEIPPRDPAGEIPSGNLFENIAIVFREIPEPRLMPDNMVLLAAYGGTNRCPLFTMSVTRGWLGWLKSEIAGQLAISE